MMDLLRRFFTSDEFLPRGHSYLWNPGLVWLHFLSDLLIGCAYVAIPLMLFALVRRIRIPFRAIIIAFGVFTGACGLTHFLEVVTLWDPIYWIGGGIKAVTAVASVATGILLVPIRPKVVEIARAAQISEERRLQLEEKASELEALYKKVKEVDALKTRFFANVSHELRTPLSLILGPVERMLGEDRLAAEDRRDLEVVARNGRNLLKLVNDLLDVSRLEAGHAEVRLAEADLSRLVREAAAHFEAAAKQRRIALQVEAPEGLPAQIDPDKTQRIVFNLLSNAIKFTPDGGRVRCTVEREGAVVVEDSGPGVPAGQRELIFERFRQGEPGVAHRLGGTGLGLAIARDFAQLQGGSLRAGDSALGGAAFRLELPVRAPPGTPVAPAAWPLPAPRSEDELQPAEEQPQLEPGKPIALVVEDDPELREFLRRSLGPELAVATARDGREGLAKALALRPDVVVTDLMMPGKGGEDLLHELRAHPELTAPVLFLTGRDDPQLRERLLRAGGQDFLGKPFAPEELKARASTLVAVKRTRELLQEEMESQAMDLETLARELVARRHQLQLAFESTRLAQQQAEKASQAKTLFLGLVSHELRTPMATLQLNLHALEREELTGRPRELLERLQRSTRRLIDLIESVLEFARLENGRCAPEVRAFDARPVAAEVVDELRAHAQQKLLDLRLAASPSLPPLHSDPRLVRLILINLVLNAVKYTERGHVELSLAYERGRHRLAVSDTGPGVPRDAQARIFEPFQVAQPLLEKHQPGFGLGLALVREIVAALGGTIELRSAPGLGTTFVVCLPPADALAQPAAV